MVCSRLFLVHGVCLNSPMLREETSLSMTYEIFNEELRLKITFGITIKMDLIYGLLPWQQAKNKKLT